MAKKYLQLSSILKKLLFEKNMKPIDLARELELPQPTIHRLVTGKSTRPYKSSLEPIADYFDISVDQLIGEEPLLADWQPKKVNASALQNIVIKTVPLIAWQGITDLSTARHQAKKQIAITGNISDQCFAILMNDHAMEPLFTKGTILIFDPHKKSVDRSYVLVKLANKEQFIFRQLLVDIDQQYLKPLNPDTAIYKMRLLNSDDTIIATLFESRTNFDTDDEDLLLENSHGV
jgi:SOS-response transcriptional repressor LexA